MTTNGYSGLYNGVHGEQHSLRSDNAPVNARTATILRTEGGQVLGEELRSVLDGNNAAKTNKRVQAVSGNDELLGGVRTMETVTQLNGAVGSTRKAEIRDKAIVVDSQASAYPNGRG